MAARLSDPRLEAAHESALLIPATAQFIELLDRVLGAAAAEVCARHDQHPYVRASLAVVLGGPAAKRHLAPPIETWRLRPPHSTPDQRAALLAEAREQLLSAFAASLAAEPEHAAARTALGGALRVAYRRHLGLGDGDADAWDDGDADDGDADDGDAERRRDALAHALLALVDGNGFRETWGSGATRASAPKVHTRDYGGPGPLEALDPAAFGDDPTAAESARALVACRGRSLPGALRRRLWRLRLGDLDGARARRVAMDLGEARRAQGLDGPSPVNAAVAALVKRALPEPWRRSLGADAAVRVADAAARALEDLYALNGGGGVAALSKRAAAAAVALAALGVAPGDGAADALAPDELLLLLHRALATLAPGGVGGGAAAAAEDALAHLERADAALASHLRGLAHGAAGATGAANFLRPVVDEYLAPLLPLDAVAFVWDHCLLDGWPAEFPVFLADVLRLLRNQLLAAADEHALRVALIDAPAKVRTCDLRDAWARRQRLNSPSKAARLGASGRLGRDADASSSALPTADGNTG